MPDTMCVETVGGTPAPLPLWEEERAAPTGVRTTCPYCGVGCGVIAMPDGTIRGDTEHPSNRGRLCSKGTALGLTLNDSERLTEPRVNDAPVTWDAALDLIAARFSEIIAAHGPDSVAFYVSGQCLTEDYYVANKLMKGFIGSGNIDTNSRLCMASSVAGHIRAFGEDVVPGVYEDWDQTDLAVLVGSNAAWCHPVLYQRLLAARAARGTRIVVLDPRRTATAEDADLHLPLAPGSDVLLFNGLLAHLAASGTADADWMARHTTGFAAALAAARADAADRAILAARCGLEPGLLAEFYDWFATTERVLTVFSQGVNQSSAGTDKVNAIINCHLATGRIGRPGMGPFSVTGQPNAMGGREVGGLANQLAAHLRFDHPADHDRLRRFWNAPRLAARPGLKAVELFDAVRDGRVKALWIVATNPAASMPRADRVRAALAACPFVVVSDCWPTDTTRFAHVVLPAAGWGEKDGTVTSSERRISRQRKFRDAPGDARPDWWMFAEVARRMGFAAAFAWDGPAAIFREHAALSGFENAGDRVFDIGALAAGGDADYEQMPPRRWPLPSCAVTAAPAVTADVSASPTPPVMAGEACHDGWSGDTRDDGEDAGRLFADGGFSTPDGRARFIPTPYRGLISSATYTLLLNTGRVRDQWHTMTRTGSVPRLMAHAPEPTVALNPADAARLDLATGDLARIETDAGAAVLRVAVTPAQRPGEVFVPMHWTDTFSSAGPIGRAVTARVDPVSGQPELKATSASVSRVTAHFHGVLLQRSGVVPPRLCHWVRMPLENGDCYRLTGLRPVPTGDALAQFSAALLGSLPDHTEWVEMEDAARGVLRRAALIDNVLQACLLLARDAASLPQHETIAPLLGAAIPNSERWRVLVGAQTGQHAETGPRVCACFGVARATIHQAVLQHGLRTTREIGEHLSAGTNCGSCLPELQAILREVSALAATDTASPAADLALADNADA
jgi:assimilatory nitrate reductase catalytic subunit